ncbi:hypothetical protein VIN01S_30720 [Vibrio inusitatus NBRC 102082]|uniref:Uncharacterized protein n=1 Tax=Vibrio inusitatus NBRC 102082 TaxID=1219070 RepID=A0A4Y3HZ13_9VIBR|nr:hypothetical protein VIN01S_30720 [Vibrio inusitatus NBRC 102082]
MGKVIFFYASIDLALLHLGFGILGCLTGSGVIAALIISLEEYDPRISPTLEFGLATVFLTLSYFSALIIYTI